jgi:tRNA threonylcarbamoyladenosine biosynthesis protein TsaE
MTKDTHLTIVPRTLTSEQDTETFALELAKQIQKLFHVKNSDFNKALHFSLVGDLGVGKTTLTRHLLRSLGHMGKVKSPTYGLCEPYQLTFNVNNKPNEITKTILPFHHFDLYRMSYAKEWMDAGFRDVFSEPGICMVEWSEKAEGTLPEADWIISLSTHDDETRSLMITSQTAIGDELIKGFQAT